MQITDELRVVVQAEVERALQNFEKFYKVFPIIPIDSYPKIFTRIELPTVVLSTSTRLKSRCFSSDT